MKLSKYWSNICHPMGGPYAPMRIPRRARDARVRRARCTPCALLTVRQALTPNPTSPDLSATCAPSEGGATTRSVAVAPEPGKPTTTTERVRARWCRCLAYLPPSHSQNLRLLRLFLVVDANALLRAHRGRGLLGDGHRPRPRSTHAPVSARRRRRPGARALTQRGAHPGAPSATEPGQHGLLDALVREARRGTAPSRTRSRRRAPSPSGTVH